MNKILSIDIGSNMGLCYTDGILVKTYYYNKVTVHNILEHLKEFLGESNVDIVLITKPVKFYTAIFSLSKLIGVVEREYKNLEYINETACNKFLMGKSRVSKQETIDYVNNLGYKNNNEHISDAIKFYLYYRTVCQH